MDKQRLLQSVYDALTRDLKNTEQSIGKTMQAAIEAPSAMESHSDTTKFQMSTVANVMQGSYATKQQGLLALETLMANPPYISRIGSYALVEVRDDQGCDERYFLLPAGGGGMYEIDGEEVIVLSDRAPLASALIGHVKGDIVTVKIQKARRLTIISVR
jgi:hypothetical protein